MLKHKNIRLLTWFNFFLDFRLYGPIAIIYFAQVTGSFAFGLAIFSIASIASSIFEVPTGIISDMIGRKRTMLFGAIASTLSIVFYALGGMLLGGSFAILAVGSLFEGLAGSLFSGNNDALLYDTLKEKQHEQEYAEFLGKVSAMFQVGLAVSALIGGFIAEVSLILVMWISVIPQAINIFLSLFIEEPKKHFEKISTNVFSRIKEALGQFKENWRLRTLSITSIVSYGVGETMHQFVPAFFALLWPTWALGIPRTLSHIFAAGSFHFAGRIIKKFQELRVLLLNTFINRIIGLIAYGFPTIISPLLVSSGSMTYGLYMVSQNSLMQKEFFDHQRATMGSLNSLFGSIFFAIFAFLFGIFADNIGPAPALLIGEILLLPLTYFYWKLFHNDRHNKTAL